MGKYANSKLDRAALWVIAAIVTALNAALLFSYVLV
jgi:Mn2+/Fe2+ NRAMP family transporter